MEADKRFATHPHKAPHAPQFILEIGFPGHTLVSFAAGTRYAKIATVRLTFARSTCV